MLETWDLIVGLVSLVGLLYLYGKWENNYFRKNGVKSIPISFPFVGHLNRVIMRKEHFKDLVYRMYNAYPEERYIGMRNFSQPLLIIKDIELIKQVSIKDFDHFLDHVSFVSEELDPIFGNNLFALTGQKWRDMRATLSPAFTSSKMRLMFEYVVECGHQMANFYAKQMEKNENKTKGLIEIELKDSFTRYTNDVIATAAFGIKVNSLEHRDNEFYTMAKKSTNFSGAQFFKFVAMIASPKLCKLFGISFFSKQMSQYYSDLVLNTMKQREELNIVRSDMIQLLMEARKGSLKHDTAVEVNKDTGFATVEESTLGKHSVKRKWTDNDIVAQAVVFFAAGFDTSSTLLCFVGHELTLNQDIQRKLQEEIDEVAAQNNGTVTYNELQSMKYLDMVVSETLRLWPPAVATDRKCIKPYSLPPPNDYTDKKYEMTTKEAVWIPIYGLHHDPEYFPNPEVFDPERFSDENKANIKPFTYLPFGIGPRNCIGSRFALMEVKAVLFHLLRQFDLVPTARTENPIQLKMDTFNLHSKNGFWVGLKPRQFS